MGSTVSMSARRSTSANPAKFELRGIAVVAAGDIGEMERVRDDFPLSSRPADESSRPSDHNTRANPGTTELSSIRVVAAGNIRERESDDPSRPTNESSRPSNHNTPPTFLVCRIWVGTCNLCVKVGLAVRGCSAKLKQKLLGETAADNTVRCQSTSDGFDIRIDVGNTPDQRPDTDPNNTLQRQSTSDSNARNNSLKGHSTISKILCAANLVLIVAIVFAQLSRPKHPYHWIAIVELSVQSTALVAMMLGFYLEAIHPSAAMWFHRTGHLLFLEGIAVAAVYRFHWPPHFIPLVLLPVPVILTPVYTFV